MDATCLINCHNYRPYVGEAVRSALEQTRPFDRVVVVDDGSTDGCARFLLSAFRGDPRVRVVSKPNAGQLSCFNRGISEAETELVFFLDADDRYRPEYLTTAMEVYRRRPEVDFLSVAPRPFGAAVGPDRRKKHRTRDIGVTALGAMLGGHWLGERTSCLSMRAATARKILPYPREQDWVTRADDVLVLGASVVGAFKHHLEEPLVDYREHGQNHFASQDFGDLAKLRRSLAVSRLVRWFADESGYDHRLLPECLHREFRTREHPTFKELMGYLGLSLRSRLPFGTRLRHVGAMPWHYAKQRLAGANSRRADAGATADNPAPAKDLADAA